MAAVSVVRTFAYRECPLFYGFVSAGRCFLARLSSHERNSPPGLLLPASTPLRAVRSRSSFRASPDSIPKKTRPPLGWSCFFWSGRRGSLAARQRRDTHTGTKTCHRHVFLAALAPCSSLGPRYAKRNTILSDGVSFWSGRRGSNSLPRPWQGRALPDELRPQTQG